MSHQYGHKTHVSQLAVVAYAGAAHGRHEVAPEEPETGLGVVLLQGPHQMAGMEVATGLAYDEIVFHKSQLFSVSIIA